MWTLTESEQRSDFFSRKLTMRAPAGEAPIKELVYEGLRSNPQLRRVLQTIVSSRNHQRVKASAVFIVHRHEDDTEEEWGFNGPVTDLNPPTVHPRDVEASTPNQLLLEFTEQIFDRLHYLQSLKGGYDITLEAIKEIVIQISPGLSNLQRIWREHEGGGVVELPEVLLRKQAVINLSFPNEVRCFAFSVMAHWLRKQGVQSVFELCAFVDRPTGRPPKGSVPPLKSCPYDFSNLTFPVSLAQLEQFELDNPSVKVYVYSWEGINPHQLRVPPEPGLEEILLLLYKGHWCLISNWSAFMSRQGELTRSPLRQADRFWCHRCMVGFRHSETLKKHQAKWCIKEEEVEIELPPEGTHASWEPHRSGFQVHLHPARVYADFETFCQEGVNKAVSYAWVLKTHGWEPPVKTGMGIARQDVGIQFLKDMFGLLQTYLRRSCAPMTLPRDHRRRFARDKAAGCYLCKQKENLHADHDHTSGLYRGMLCRTCNTVGCRQPKSLLIVMHNASRFDWSFIVRAFAKYKLTGPEWLSKYDLQVLPKSTNQFLSIQIGNSRVGSLQFIDSFKHQAQPLEKLIASQRKFGSPEEAFPTMASLHPWRHKLPHLLRKLPFPYEALGEDPDTWCEMPALLPQEAFNNSLTKTKCSDQDYQEIKAVFGEIGLSNFLELHCCYLWTDVMALADVMEFYSREFWLKFRLDPLHFLTISAASYNACLKAIGPRFELPSSLDFLSVINQSIMGGIAWAAYPYFKRAPGCRFHCCDAIQLYPSQMVKKLPTGDYRQIVGSESELMVLCQQLLDTWTMDSETGFLIVCDFHVPSEFHNEIDLPPCAKMKVTKDLLSKEQQGQPETEKLVPFLGEHKSSGRHIALLQCWRRFCHIQITKVHQIWAFKQEAVLKDFIEEVVRCRRESTTEPQRALHKMISTSIWGKLLERVDKRSTAKLTTDPWRFHKAVAQKRCTGWQVLEGADGQPTDNGFLGLYNMRAGTVTCNTPRPAAWAILDLSKVAYYSWWYGCIKHLWPEAKMYAMDTDSAMFSIRSESFLEEALKWNQTHTENLFDLSEFGHKELHGQLGAWKEELGPTEVLEGAFLTSKVYSYKMSEKDKCRAKGVPKAVLNSYRFETFSQLLRDPKPVIETFEALRTVNQQSIKRTEVKKTLTIVNDKIWREKLGPEEWVCRPLGHYLNKEK